MLAAHSPAHIYFTGRSSSRATSLIADLSKSHPATRVSFVPCDLASLSSVAAAAKQFTAAESRLDVLLCNAGIMATPTGLTADGYEVQFGTNFLGHALLIKLLLPTLLHTAGASPSTAGAGTPAPGAGDARVVILTSQGFAMHPSGGIQFARLRTPMSIAVLGPWQRYGQSKLAGMLFARALAVHYPQLSVVSVHPGVVYTGLVEGLGLLNRAFVKATTTRQTVSVEEGSYNSCWAATTERNKLVNGEFYEPVGKPGNHSRESRNDVLAQELWDWTESELKRYSLD